MESSKSHEEYVKSRVEEVEKYYDFTNSILGAIAIALAIASVETENQFLFGAICFLFVVSVWLKGIVKFKNALADLQVANHKMVSNKSILINSLPAIFGMGLLLAVTSETICSGGLCT